MEVLIMMRFAVVVVRILFGLLRACASVVREAVLVFLYIAGLSPAYLARVLRLRRREGSSWNAESSWQQVTSDEPEQPAAPGGSHRFTQSLGIFYRDLLPGTVRQGEWGLLITLFVVFHLGILTAEKRDEPWEQPYIYANF
jgi:hypothetical protein